MPPFEFPPIAEKGIVPIWNEGRFSIGDESAVILEYISEKANFDLTKCPLPDAYIVSP